MFTSRIFRYLCPTFLWFRKRLPDYPAISPYRNDVSDALLTWVWSVLSQLSF